jgi:hypothetical protein
LREVTLKIIFYMRWITFDPFNAKFNNSLLFQIYLSVLHFTLGKCALIKMYLFKCMKNYIRTNILIHFTET